MLWKHYHQKSKNTPENASSASLCNRNREWLTTHYKIYERYEVQSLPNPTEISYSFSELIRNRKTNYSEKSSGISLQNISNILFNSVGETDGSANGGQGRRAIASGGARFPIETYVISMQKTNTLPLGVYHYRVDNHSLEHLPSEDIYEILNKGFFIQPESTTYNYCFVFTAVFDRTVNKYAERGYRLALLEAGAAGQAIQNASVTQGISSVILSGIYDSAVEKLIGVDGVSESVVNAVLIR